MNDIILNEGQEKVVQEALKFLRDDSRQVFEFSGKAGTGKSVVLHEIIKRSGLMDCQIACMAFTGAAAIVMRTRGFTQARSIHSWLYQLVKVPKKTIPQDESDPFNKFNLELNKPEFEYKFLPIEVGKLNPSIQLFIIDEGYMVPDFMKRDILKHGRKVIVAGDSNQLPPIGGEPAFLTGDNVMHLTQLMRQAETNPIVYIANRAIEGKPIHCGQYGNRVLVIPDTDFSNDMLMNVGNIICGTNKTRDYFNNLIRSNLQLDPKFPRYGERLICRNNNWNLTMDNISLANGLTGIISSPVSMNSYSNGNVLKIDFLPDLLTHPFEGLSINYKYLISDYNERQKIKDSKFGNNNGELFEYAYALTTHLAQGSEYPCGIFYEEFLRSNIQQQLCYTGITRFKEYMIYVKKTAKKYY